MGSEESEGSVEEQVKEAFKEFREIQSNYAHLGALDSEPQWVAENYLACALNFRAKPAKLPKTADDWEL